MSVTGRYCKAYPVKTLQAFPGWPASAAAPLEDDSSYLFLQENYVVTKGVFSDEEIVFEAITDEWKSFCQHELEFSIPDYVLETSSTQAAG